MIAPALLVIASLAVTPPGRGRVPSASASQVEVCAAAIQAFDEAARIGGSDPTAARRLYEQARDGFESLVDDGVENGRLLYNLGNTYVRLGQIGQAIACYRRAERLIPGDPQLAENLRFARSLRQDQISPPATAAALRSLFFWHYGTPLALRSTLALAAFAAFWALMAARLFVRARHAALVWSARAVAVLTLTLACSVGLELYEQRTTRAGVITANNVVLRKGNGESYEPRFDHRFSDGVEFVLTEPPRGDWLHIALPDGKDGWIRSDQAELL
jgi:hypothetical protein